MLSDPELGKPQEIPKAVVTPEVRQRKPKYNANGRVNVEAVMDDSKALRMTCPSCGSVWEISVPIDFSKLTCDCGGTMDPMDWPGAHAGDGVRLRVIGTGRPPVNHRLTQRLIAACYRNPEFALKILMHFRRDWDHAKVQEWGIDKPLLLTHAAHATLIRGHGSPVPFIVLGIGIVAGFLPSPLSFFCIPLLLIALVLASGNSRAHTFWRKHCRANAYDPSQIDPRDFEGTQEILKHCEATEPKNLFFFRGFEPFDLLGQRDESWSLLIDRRKRADDRVSEEAAELDLAETTESIVNRIAEALTGRRSGQVGKRHELPLTRIRIDDVVLASGCDIRSDPHQIIDGSGVPQTSLSNEKVQEIAGLDEISLRTYKRVSYYDPQRDLGMMTFFRLANKGPFTYIESSGTRLLPTLDRFMGKYTDEPTADELSNEAKIPEWFRDLPIERRRQIRFTAGGLSAFLVVWFPLMGALAAANAADPSSPSTTSPASLMVLAAWLIPLIMLVASYGTSPKLTDDFEVKNPGVLESILTLGLVAILPYRPEKERLERRDHVYFQKKTGEWDFGPTLNALRVWQSRSYTRNRFESTDLLLLRKATDLTMQEAFLQCLEDAGIDTSEFREGAAIINNYGIINRSGQIEGGATVQNTHETKQPEQKPQEPKTRSGPKRMLAKQHGGGE